MKSSFNCFMVKTDIYIYLSEWAQLSMGPLIDYAAITKQFFLHEYI